VGAEAFADIPIATVADLGEADAIIFGTPTRFGNMTGQMRQFLDATGGLWTQGSWSARWQRVCQLGHAARWPGTTILSFHTTLLHHGMVVVGCRMPSPARCASMNHRRLSLWRIDHRGGKASACRAKTSSRPRASRAATSPRSRRNFPRSPPYITRRSDGNRGRESSVLTSSSAQAAQTPAYASEWLLLPVLARRQGHQGTDEGRGGGGADPARE